MKQILCLLVAIIIPFHGLFAERFIPKSDLIYKVLNIVNHLYVDHNRIQPVKMLEGSLEKLSLNIAPVLTKLEKQNNKVIIDVSVDQFKRNFSFNTPKDVIELNYILQQVVSFVKQYLEKGEKPEFIDYAVINGFLSKLDPHSSLLIPEIYSDFSTQTSGNFGGVGMMISIHDGDLTIISPIDNTPAARAGLKAKDKIVQINEESTINMPLSDAVKKLRGKEGTEVDIYIMRKGFTAPRKITIVRDIIEINSVKSFTFKDNGKRVGLLKINTFQQNTIDEINSHLEDLDYDLKDFYGLIIDLRNNPGGLLEQAIEVSDRFINEGVIVSTAGLNSKSIKSYNARWFRSITSIPIIILINNGSASASEIVTAALKKNDRAVVIGIQTFGKGSVQQVIPFPSGSALKLTTSKYLTPGNISIQSVGVSPHVAVNPYYISNDYLHVTTPKLENAEKSLDENFSEWGDKTEPPLKSVFYLYENDENGDKEEEEDFSHKELEKKRMDQDFLVQSAIKILIGNERKGFSHLLEQSIRYFDEEQNSQEQNLIEKFASFSTPLDWRSYQTDEIGEISTESWIEIKEKVGEKEMWKPIKGIIPADSEIRLYLKAKNIGNNRISRLIALSECKNQILDERQFAFGKLEPGEAKTWFIPINISKSAESRSDLVKFLFSDEKNQEIYTSNIIIQTREKELPEFYYTISTMENGQNNSKGNADGRISKDERVAVKVDIINKGTGKSGALTVLLKNGEGEDVFLNIGRLSLENIDIGESASAFFQFDLKKEPSDGDLDFSLDIIDSVFTISSMNHKIKFPVNEIVAPITNMPPSIQLINSKLVSSDEDYPLELRIDDEKGVKDVYIFNNRKKIYYKNFLDLKNRSSVNVKLEVPLDLEEENNRIIIVSRDDDNVISQKNLNVRYSSFK
ncbi:PDZ domain-containing protein [bacterium]|nr:PDZ domain-containing protein [bacterium]